METGIKFQINYVISFLKKKNAINIKSKHVTYPFYKVFNNRKFKGNLE